MKCQRGKKEIHIVCESKIRVISFHSCWKDLNVWATLRCFFGLSFMFLGSPEAFCSGAGSTQTWLKGSVQTYISPSLNATCSSPGPPSPPSLNHPYMSVKKSPNWWLLLPCKDAVKQTKNIKRRGWRRCKLGLKTRNRETGTNPNRESRNHENRCQKNFTHFRTTTYILLTQIQIHISGGQWV